MNYNIDALIEQIEELPAGKAGDDQKAVVACMKALRTVFGHPEMPLVMSFVSYTLIVLRIQAERDRQDCINAEEKENELRPRLL